MSGPWPLVVGALVLLVGTAILSFCCGLMAGLGWRVGGKPLPRRAATAPTPPRRRRGQRAEPSSAGRPFASVSTSRPAADVWPTRADDTFVMPGVRYYPDYGTGWYHTEGVAR